MRKMLSLIAMLALVVTTPALAGWDEGVAAFKAGNYQAAYTQFQEYVQSNPDAYQGQFMLGQVATKLKRKDEALTHLRKAYDLNPNDLSIKLALATAYAAVGRHGDVSKLLASVDPSTLPAAQKPFFYQTRANARLKSGDEAGASKDLGQLVTLKPNDAAIQYNYGTTALSSGNTNEGLAALRKSAELEPKNQDYRRAYAQALILNGRRTKDKATKKQRYTQAADAAQALVGIEASYDNLILLTSAEIGAGRYTQAAATAQKALAKNGSAWLPYFYLGQAYTSSGQFVKAEEPLNKARGLATKDQDKRMVVKQLGFSYEKQKKYAAAVQAYEQAGDAGAVARVRENEKTAAFNEKVEEDNERIKDMETEARRLEEELKALEGGGGLL